MNVTFTKNAALAIQASVSEASSLGHTCIGSEHLLLGILKQESCSASKILKEFNITHENFYSDVKTRLGSGAPTSLTQDARTPRFDYIVSTAGHECVKRGNNSISTGHLLFGILLSGDCEAVRSLVSLGADITSIGKKIVESFRSEQTNAPANEKSSSSSGISGLENLSKFSRDLTALAREGKIDPVIGRDTETERLIQILSRRTKNNPCLIGEPGVGKTAVVEGLAAKIAAGNVPETLKDKTLCSLDVSAMLA